MSGRERSRGGVTVVGRPGLPFVRPYSLTSFQNQKPQTGLLEKCYLYRYYLRGNDQAWRVTRLIAELAKEGLL